MELRKTLTGTMVAVASLVALTAAPQSPPITSDTGRFGDATSIARKYQDYIYGVIKEKKPDELILTKTKFGVDQSSSSRRRPSSRWMENPVCRETPSGQKGFTSTWTRVRRRVTSSRKKLSAARCPFGTDGNALN